MMPKAYLSGVSMKIYVGGCFLDVNDRQRKKPEKLAIVDILVDEMGENVVGNLILVWFYFLSASPCLMASTAACVRSETPNLANTLLR